MLDDHGKMWNACSHACERVCSISLQSDTLARNIVSSNSNIWFEQNHIFVGHQTWNDIVGSQSNLPLFNVLETFKNVVSRNGAAMVLMADENSIMYRMDRLTEVLDVAQNANATRQALGLQVVDLQTIGL